MPDPILQEAAERMQEFNQQIERSQELVNALKEAGEPYSELQTEINKLRVRKAKWEHMLKSRGYKVK